MGFDQSAEMRPLEERNRRNKRRLVIVECVAACSLLLNAVMLRHSYHEKGYALKGAASSLSRQQLIAPEPYVQSSLQAMNRTPLPPFVRGEFGSRYARTVRLAVLGNSIAYHGIAPEIGWTRGYGMAATSPDTDYVHLLVKHISESEKVRVDYRIVNLASFERDFRTFDLGIVRPIVAFSPDVIIFQLGENVDESPGEVEALAPYYESLVRLFPSSKRVLTLPFFPLLRKNELVERVAVATRSYVVDLSHLSLLDKTCQRGFDNPVSNVGINMHPGDKGMASIAAMLFLEVDPIIYDLSHRDSHGRPAATMPASSPLSDARKAGNRPSENGQ